MQEALNALPSLVPRPNASQLAGGLHHRYDSYGEVVLRVQKRRARYGGMLVEGEQRHSRQHRRGGGHTSINCPKSRCGEMLCKENNKPVHTQYGSLSVWDCGRSLH